MGGELHHLKLANEKRVALAVVKRLIGSLGRKEGLLLFGELLDELGGVGEEGSILARVRVYEMVMWVRNVNVVGAESLLDGCGVSGWTLVGDLTARQVRLLVEKVAISRRKT